MKILIAIVVLIALGVGGFILWNPTPKENADTPQNTTGIAPDTDAKTVEDGTYTVIAEESDIRWSGKKPLIDGYVNSGSFDVTDGEIVVSNDSATGSFTIDMNTLTVSETKAKPGQETALEGHLKGERWFNVATYPTATFEILEVTPREDSDTTFMYDIRGNLTLKGQAHELTFPATIFESADGTLRATADFEFDRTQWGITAGSSSFFDNLADNAISDMVALSFSLVAKK